MPKRRRRSLIGAGGRAALWLVVATALAMASVLVAPHNLGLWDKYPIVQLEALQLGWIIALFLLICMVAVALWHSRHQKYALHLDQQEDVCLCCLGSLDDFVGIRIESIEGQHSDVLLLGRHRRQVRRHSATGSGEQHGRCKSWRS